MSARSRKAFKPEIEALEQLDLMSATQLMGPIVDTTWHASAASFTAADYSAAGNATANAHGAGDVRGDTNGEYLDPSTQPTAVGLAIINSLPDVTVRQFALEAYQAGASISYSELLNIFSEGSIEYTSLSNNAFASMKKLVDNGPTLGMPEYVRWLGDKVLTSGITGTPTAATFRKQVGKFMLGEERPIAGALGTAGYQQVQKPMWIGQPKAQDVPARNIGYTWSNWLLTGLEEVVWRKRADITSMMIDNGNNTYTVRFFDRMGKPLYVIVDNYFPTASNWDFGYSDNSQVIWPALILKAYAQSNMYGQKLQSLSAEVSYKAVGMPGPGAHPADTAAHPGWVWEAIAGLDVLHPGLTSASSVAEKWQQGHYVALKTARLSREPAYGVPRIDEASPIFYPEVTPGGLADQPRWYALVNYVPDDEWGGRFTVTQDGQRFIEVAGKVLAKHLSTFTSTYGSTVPVPPSSSYFVGSEPIKAVQISPYLPGNTGRFVDQDGDIYTIKLSGPGNLEVQLDDLDGDGRGAIAQIHLSGTDAVKSSLTVTVKKAAGGDGVVAIGQIDGPALKSLIAKASDLKDNISITGLLGVVTLRNVNAGAVIDTGGQSDNLTAVTVNDVGNNAVIRVGSTIKSLKATTVGSAYIEAAALGTLTTKGDFDADLRLRGSAATVDLKSATIGGSIEHAIWSIVGDVGTIAVKGSSSDWHVNLQGNLMKATLADVSDSALAAHTVQSLAVKSFLDSDLTAAGTIASFTAGTFMNSNVSAGVIGKAALKAVTADNNGVKFGIRAEQSIGAVKASNLNFTFNPKLASPQGVGDFEVEVI